MEERLVENAEECGHSFTVEQLGTVAVKKSRSAQRLGYFS